MGTHYKKFQLSFYLEDYGVGGEREETPGQNINEGENEVTEDWKGKERRSDLDRGESSKVYVREIKEEDEGRGKKTKGEQEKLSNEDKVIN